MERGTFKAAWKKYWYLYLFIIFTAFSLFRIGKGWAEEYDPRRIMNSRIYHMESSISCEFDNQFEANNICKFHTMNAEYDECKTFAEKRDFHKKNAERCLNDAKNLCWYMPDRTMKENSQYAFRNIAVLACPGDPKSKLITALVTTLIEYGVDCYEEWSSINTKLHWAQYHYEMYELYSEIVRQGSR